MNETTSDIILINSKIKDATQRYANLCAQIGEIDYKIKNMNGDKESFLIAIHNYLIQIGELNKELEKAQSQTPPAPSDVVTA